jgi:hypothetical protein
MQNQVYRKIKLVGNFPFTLWGKPLNLAASQDAAAVVDQ